MTKEADRQIRILNDYFVLSERGWNPAASNPTSTALTLWRRIYNRLSGMTDG